MRIAFVGHSHHLKTGSSTFFLDVLRRRGSVETFWDESWRDGGEFDLGPLVLGRFDAVVVWQVETLAPRVAQAGLPNVTFFPMYDGCYNQPDSYWESMRAIKIVCFSSTLHERLQRLGLRSRHVRYFPDPTRIESVASGPGLAGYFWQRQQDVTWRTICQLVGDAAFDRLTLHRALDPTFGEFVSPTKEEVQRHRIRITDWFADRADAQRELASHNVYFAPRIREGIGMSFLEAMAMGQLVVAADQPTMNEYLVSGVNGLLYDPDDPRSLDFSGAPSLAARARRTVELGWAKWNRCVEPLLRFVEAPSVAVPVWAPLDGLDPWAIECPAAASPAAPVTAQAEAPPGPLEGGARLRDPGARPDRPAVTVAVVTFNATTTLAATLESIHRQTWADRELIVLDGASKDGTVGVIRTHEDQIDYWRSQPDGGPYEAMNEAARLARGRYVIFMNAGDVFQTTDALALALDRAPPDADVIFGHHVYRHPAGHEELHLAADFAATWSSLRRGEVGWRWLSRVPGHQATLTRTELLRENPYRRELRLAADHDVLYRLALRGVRFHHANAVISTYVGGGLSWQNQERCFEEWRRIALLYTEHSSVVARIFDEMRVSLERQMVSRLPWPALLLRSCYQSNARSVLWQRARRSLFRSRRLGRRFRRTKYTLLRLGGAELATTVRAIAGFSPAEGWGRWTDGARATIELKAPIPRPRRVTLRIVQAYGPNVGQQLVVRVGDRAYRHKLAGGEHQFSVKLDRRGRAPIARIDLEIPAPASPRERGEGNDGRRLGVALRTLEIASRRW